MIPYFYTVSVRFDVSVKNLDTICTVIEKRLDDPTREDADDPLKAGIYSFSNEKFCSGFSTISQLLERIVIESIE